MPGYQFLDLKTHGGSTSAFRNFPTRMIILCLMIIVVVLFFTKSDLWLPLKSENWEQSPFPSFLMGTGKSKEKTFYEIARSTHTSKVGAPELDWRHARYECIYEDALVPYRHRPNLKILELGLGCDMWYGPGASHTVWKTYFDDPDIYFLEYDKKCGEKWHANLTGKKPTMTYCSQNDIPALQKMVADYGPWDLIIDDCVHNPAFQVPSFKELFPALNPGGMYFIEDIGLAPGFKKGTPESRGTISFMADLYALSIVRQGLGKNLERITCCDQVCGFKSVDPKIVHPPLNF